MTDTVCKKILELTKNKEAVVTDKIPRKVEMSSRTELQEIKREEVKQFNGAFFNHPFRLIQKNLT